MPGRGLTVDGARPRATSTKAGTETVRHGSGAGNALNFGPVY
jgi:hypothetical protein